MSRQLRPGDSIETIDTPALVIDLDAMDRNLLRMSAFARAHGVRLRPHAKMHKCAAIAKLRSRQGRGSVRAEAGRGGDPRSGPAGHLHQQRNRGALKLKRVATLARTVRLAVAVDSGPGIEGLAQACAQVAEIDVFVEVEVGQGCCGTAPQDAGRLAALVHRNRAGIALRRPAGLSRRRPTLALARRARARGAAGIALARMARASVEAVGLACPLVTGAGTGTFMHEAASGHRQIQPGSYLFMDRDYADNQPDPREAAFEHALFVKSQVISLSPTHAVVDAGHKCHAIDSGPPRRSLSSTFANGGDEHGILRARPGAGLPALGETVWPIPGHCDPTVNLHDQLVAVRGGLHSDRSRPYGSWTPVMPPLDERHASQHRDQRPPASPAFRDGRLFRGDASRA